MKALERPVWLALCDPPPVRSGKRWKFWDDAPPLAPLDGELCEVGIASLVPPLEALLGAEFGDSDVSPEVETELAAPLVGDEGCALVDAPPVEPDFGGLWVFAGVDCGARPCSDALPVPDPFPLDPALAAVADEPDLLALGLDPPEPPEDPPLEDGPDGGFPALAPAAALDDDAILLALPEAAEPARAIPAAATPAAPPTAKPPTASAPAPSAGPPETSAAARLGANSDNMARMIAAVRIVMAS